MTTIQRDELTPLTSSESPVNKGKAKVSPQFFAALVASLAAVACGMALGYSSPSDGYFKHKYSMDSKQISWFNSLLAAGSVIGCFVAGILVEKTGRKTTVLLTALPYTLGYLCILVAWSHHTLYLGRIITGIGTGMTTISLPLYTAEVGSKDYRGTLGTFLQLGITLGILTSFSLGILLGADWLAVASSTVPLLLVSFMIMMPETPRWLLKHSTDERTIHSLIWLRGSSQATHDEFNEIKLLLEFQERQRPFSFRDFQKPPLFKPLIISLVLLIIQQLSGVNAVVFYANTIFVQAGYDFQHGSVPSIIVAGVQVVFTLLACLLVDTAGRKHLLVFSGIFMSIGCVAFGVGYFMQSKYLTNPGILSVISLCVYYASFSVGWGPVPWIIMSETFPVKARSAATAIAATVNWTFAFIITKLFNTMTSKMGNDWTFWSFGIVMALGVIFVIFFVVETKGKSLEELERHFQSQNETFQEI